MTFIYLICLISVGEVFFGSDLICQIQFTVMLIYLYVILFDVNHMRMSDGVNKVSK